MSRTTGPDFDAAMGAYQASWRKTHCVSQTPGQQNQRAYPWILPRSAWEEGLWPELRQHGRYPLADYLKRESIQKHAGVHNLKSSWILCANLYWPFGQSETSRAMLAAFLNTNIDVSIQSVSAVEFEWAPGAPLSPAELLGETGGQRGAGQTSPDIAFFVTTDEGASGVILTENKFVEHSFYRCSARRTEGSAERPGNFDRDRCLRPLDVLNDHKAECHQHAWGRLYWQRLASAADAKALAALKACPGAFAGYQLLRQQALAEALAEAGAYHPVVSCVAYDARNTVLQSSLKSTGLDHFNDWGSLFPGTARFASFTHQQWIAHVAAHDQAAAWDDWLNYVQTRYDLK